MIQFLIKGVLRDKSKSLLPTVIVTLGVFVVVVMCGFMDGMLNNMVNTTANFDTGHVKVMSRAYEKEKEQQPLDLAMYDVAALTQQLEQQYPEMEWYSRISYGMLIDIPDENGNSIGQAPVAGMAYDLLSDTSNEADRIGLERILIAGKGITHKGEILVSKDLANRFQLKEGSIVTLFGSDMNGSMAFANRRVAGVVQTGIGMLDRGAIFTDIADTQEMLDMEDATTQILGFARNGIYNDERCRQIKAEFNASTDANDPYAPVMLVLSEQNGMGNMLQYADSMSVAMLILLMFALALVLWNTGVLGSIRRYGEFGIRIAIGESKRHIVSTLLSEALLIGLIGSTVGTVLGLSACYYLQEVGLDYSALLENMSMMVDPVIKAQISPYLCYIGFIPGVVSILAGTALASRAIFKRETANLFKELD